MQKNTDIYLRETISLLLGGLFFSSLIINILRKSKFNLFLISPFIGATLILIHVITGFPKNNFDPLRGDSLKPFYFSFLLCLSFVFLMLIYLKRNKKTKYLLIPYIVVILVLIDSQKILKIKMIKYWN